MVGPRMGEQRVTSDVVEITGICVSPATKAAGLEATVGDEVNCLGVPRDGAKQSGSAED